MIGEFPMSEITMTALRICRLGAFGAGLCPRLEATLAASQGPVELRTTRPRRRCACRPGTSASGFARRQCDISTVRCTARVRLAAPRHTMRAAGVLRY